MPSSCFNSFNLSTVIRDISVSFSAVANEEFKASFALARSLSTFASSAAPETDRDSALKFFKLLTPSNLSKPTRASSSAATWARFNSTTACALAAFWVAYIFVNCLTLISYRKYSKRSTTPPYAPGLR